MSEQLHGIEAVFPTRSGQPRQRLEVKKRRSHTDVGHRIGWLQKCRRVAAQHDKLATHFLTIVKLTMIQNCLRLNDQSTRTKERLRL